MTASFAPSVAPTAPEPIAVLREYRTLAPWSLRDLAAVAAAVLEASDVVPLNAAARARPTERTIRFYVTRGLVSPPEGRGTAAVYGYRHLLQVLAIKLRQMEGATLDTLSAEFAGMTGDVMAEDPLCTHTPGKFAGASLLTLRPAGSLTAGATAIEYGREAAATIAWDDAAAERMKKIPAFVRGMVVRAVEESCRKNGLDRVTVEELERIRARMPTPKMFGSSGSTAG